MRKYRIIRCGEAAVIVEAKSAMIVDGYLELYDNEESIVGRFDVILLTFYVEEDINDKQ